MRLFPLLIVVLIILTACGTSKEPVNTDNETNKLDIIKIRTENAFKKTGSDVEVTKQGKFYDVSVVYDPTKLFDKRSSTEENNQKLIKETFNALRRISLADPNMRVMTLRTISTSHHLDQEMAQELVHSKTDETVTRETSFLQLTKDEWTEISGKSDAMKLLEDLLIIHPHYQIERNLVGQRDFSAYFIDTKDIFDNSTNETRTTAIIIYVPSDSGDFGTADNAFDVFENNLVRLMRSSFEQAETVDEIFITVMMDKPENRTENASQIIASLNLTREKFSEVMVNWDNLRSQIFDRIEYNPLYLMDMVSHGKIVQYQHGSTTTVNYYLDKYSGITQTIEHIEGDSADMAWAMFDRFPEVKKIILIGRVMLPAPEGAVTIDGVHEILSDGFQVTMTSSEVAKMNREALTDRQILFNFDPFWNDRMLELNLESALGYGANTREIIVNAKAGEAFIHVDTCRWKRLEKNKAIAVENALVGSAYNALFMIHPPYLDEVTIYADKIFVDNYGVEDVETLAQVTLERNDDAQWFNPDIEDLSEWYDITDEDNEITDGTVLCQIMTV